MPKKQLHQCAPACNTLSGLAAHNRAVLASLNEDAEIVEWAPAFKDVASGRKPWPALERQWAGRGVTVSGPDECGFYAYTSEDGVTLYSFGLSAPAKPRLAAALPKLTATGTPSLFAGFKRSKVRDLTAAECEHLYEDLWAADLEPGKPEHLSAKRAAVRIGAAVYVFEPLACRAWRPDEIAAKEANYRDKPGDRSAIPWHKPHEHSAPAVSMSVIVTDKDARAGTLYTETEEEQIDVFA